MIEFFFGGIYLLVGGDNVFLFVGGGLSYFSVVVILCLWVVMVVDLFAVGLW